MDASDAMDALSPTKDFMLTYLMPEKCYDIFFVRFNFLHAPCIQIVLSKTVGVWILLAMMAPFLQLLRVLRARSAEGLSFCSVLLQLYSISGPLLFCMAHNFPIGAWGERLFMSIQTALIGFLILHYRGNTFKGLWFLVVYASVLYLAAPVVPPAVVSTMQASSVAAVVASKVIQAWCNSMRGHTGQLSCLSVFLVWAASLALILPSLQDTGTSLDALLHVLSAGVSCVLLGQVLHTRSSTRSSAASAAAREKSE